jgi:hypothetical protein
LTRGRTASMPGLRGVLADSAAFFCRTRCLGWCGLNSFLPAAMSVPIKSPALPASTPPHHRASPTVSEPCLTRVRAQAARTQLGNWEGGICGRGHSPKRGAEKGSGGAGSIAASVEAKGSPAYTTTSIVVVPSGSIEYGSIVAHSRAVEAWPVVGSSHFSPVASPSLWRTRDTTRAYTMADYTPMAYKGDTEIPHADENTFKVHAAAAEPLCGGIDTEHVGRRC